MHFLNFLIEFKHFEKKKILIHLYYFKDNENEITMHNILNCIQDTLKINCTYKYGLKI